MTNPAQRFPERQRSNLQDGLASQLQRKLDEEELSYNRAFSQVALGILGYDQDLGIDTDGSGDFGIDFGIVDERTATIFQFKSQDFTSGFDASFLAGPSVLTDIPRINSLISDLDNIPDESNANVKHFLKELRSAIHRFSQREQSQDATYDITIYFCCLAKAFTLQAAEEFSRFASDRIIKTESQAIRISTGTIFIDDLLAEDWRESNTDWRTAGGEKDDKIELHVCGEMIESPNSLVFFTKAYDLVNAFDRFGYQIFEPNVRCELKRSKVNEAIRESIRHARGRKEFKHLNNGITLICANFQKVHRTPTAIVRMRQPGVINGLQTVKSMHDAYDELDEKQKGHFGEECEILVRLHTRNAVADYKELVKSTNNQNPMQARNLRSNDLEQIQYEKLFADINWFYERKEGAWKAFKSDHSLWGSLRGRKSSDFRSTKSGQIRNVDNLDLSQAWLSFIGFSNEAIHNKRDIFTEDKFYDLIFKQRVIKHGYDYNFSFNDPAVRAEAEEQAPNAQSLLLSYLLREIADGLTPSRKQNRDAAVTRLRIQKQSKESQDSQLVQDASYVRGLVLAGAKYLFVDFCGLVLLRALGKDFYRYADFLLHTRSIRTVFADHDFNEFHSMIENDDYQPGDIFGVLWGLYNYCLENLVEQATWRQQFEQAAVRSRFNYSDYNRRSLFSQLESLDRVYQKRAVPQPWSQGMEEHAGIFSYEKGVPIVCAAVNVL